MILFNTYNLYPDENIAIMHIKEQRVIIDLEDFDKVVNTKWVISNKRPVRYWSQNNTSFTEPLYRLLVEVRSGLTIDYKNGDRLDLRKSNLRECTFKERVRHHNLRKRNTTGKSGVSRTKGGGYLVSINIDKDITEETERLLIPCETLPKAIRLRKSLEKRFYGEYAPIQ